MDVNSANGGEYGEAAGGIRSFKGVADFGAYDMDDTDPKVDEAVVQAWTGSDDNEVVKVYTQEIKGVSVTAADSNPPASNPGTTATVKVVDQYGKAIAGAQVIQSAPAATMYTDVNGEATFDVTGDADGNTYTYLVNVDGEADYQSSKDYQRSVTVTTYDDMTAGIAAGQVRPRLRARLRRVRRQAGLHQGDRQPRQAAQRSVRPVHLDRQALRQGRDRPGG